MSSMVQQNLAKVRGGSLIIEEISDFSLDSQARIVQMIDNPGEHSPRFIATMQGSMIKAVETGLIRSDVFYRLGGATIELLVCANVLMIF